MAVIVETPETTYLANGVATTFAIGFTYSAATHVKVEVDGALVTSGLTVSGADVIFDAAPADEKGIRIFRQTPLDQPAPFEDPAKTSLDELEDGLDRIVRQLQERELRLAGASSSVSGDQVVSSAWNGRTVELSGSTKFILPGTHAEATRFTVLSTGFTVVCSADYVFKGTLATGGNLSTFSPIPGTTHLTAIEFIGGKWTIYDLDTYT